MTKKRILVILVLIIGAYLVISLSRQLFSLWQAGGRIEKIRKRVEEAREENERLKRKLSFVQSEEFLEREARNKLNLAKPEETIVVVPQEVIKMEVERAQKEKERRVEIPNWRRWYKAFFGDSQRPGQ